MNSEVLIKFKADTEDVDKKTESLGSKLKDGFGSALKTGAASLAIVGAAAAATTKAFWNGANATAAYGDEIDKTSQKVGFSTDAYQKWDYAMNISGTSMQNCTIGLKTMTNKIDDAINGSSQATEMFERLGISLDDLKGKSREDIFGMVVEGLQNVEDGVTKAALANDFFGRSGQDLMPLFNATAESTKNLMEEAEKYGMVMSEDAVKSSADFKDALTKMENTMGGIKNRIMGSLMPSFTTLMDGFSDLAAGQEGATQRISEGITGVVEKISSTIPMISGIVKDLIPQLLPVISDILMAVSQAIVENLPILVDGIIQLLPGLIEGIVMLVTKIIEMLPDIVIMIADMLPTMIPMLVDAILQIIPALLEHLPDFIKAGGQLLLGLAKGIIMAVPNLLKQVANVGKSIVKGIKGIFGIHSPSKVMAKEIGQYLPKGMAVGIEANADSVTDAIGNIQKDINGTFGMGAQTTGAMNNNLSPIVNVYSSFETDPLGQMVRKIKTGSGGAKNDYSYGYGGV